MDESRDDRLGLTFDDRPSSKLRVRMWIRCDQRGRIEGSAHRENASVKPRGGCQRSVEKDSRQKTVFSARTVYLGIIPCTCTIVHDLSGITVQRVYIYIYINVR